MEQGQRRGLTESREEWKIWHWNPSDKDWSCGFVLAIRSVRENEKKGHIGPLDLGERSLLEMGRSE